MPFFLSRRLPLVPILLQLFLTATAQITDLSIHTLRLPNEQPVNALAVTSESLLALDPQAQVSEFDLGFFQWQRIFTPASSESGIPVGTFRSQDVKGQTDALAVCQDGGIAWISPLYADMQWVAPNDGKTTVALSSEMRDLGAVASGSDATLFIAALGDQQSVQVEHWNMSSGAMLRRWTLPKSDVDIAAMHLTGVQVAADGLAVVSFSSSIYWLTATSREALVLETQWNDTMTVTKVEASTVSSGGLESMAVVSYQNMDGMPGVYLGIWNTTDTILLSQTSIPLRNDTGIVGMCESMGWIYVAWGDGTIMVWNLATGSPEGYLCGQLPSLSSLTCSPSGIYAGANDGSIRVFMAGDKRVRGFQYQDWSSSWGASCARIQYGVSLWQMVVIATFGLVFLLAWIVVLVVVVRRMRKKKMEKSIAMEEAMELDDISIVKPHRIQGIKVMF